MAAEVAASRRQAAAFDEDPGWMDVTGARVSTLFPRMMDAAELGDQRYNTWAQVLEAGVPESLSAREALQWRQEVGELLAVDDAVSRFRAMSGMDEAGRAGRGGRAHGAAAKQELLSRATRGMERL
eukprot:3438681-Prymnesium_polylepis.1